MDEVEIRVSYQLTTDSDDFLRRQCPKCAGRFKWHVGPASREAEDHADAGVYYCPLCGSPDEAGNWHTPEQVAFIQATIDRAAAPVMNDMISETLKGLEGPNIKVKRTGHLDVPAGPDPLVEADDMVIVASPCHGYEPAKIPEGWGAPPYCLVCGSRFLV